MNRETALSIAERLGFPPDGVATRPVAGGDIASAHVFEGGGRRIFVKSMPPAASDVLDAERDGLSRIAATGAVRVPAVLGSGCGELAWLALEFLDLRRPSDRALAELGTCLAELHANRASSFGLERDNFIGATPQRNDRCGDWTEFLFDRRIGDQVRRLGGNFGPGDVERLREAWLRRFPGYAPDASLVHGDLWAGNAAMLPDGTPTVFDPAAHYADRECDLAMARMFGGFGEAFFDAYARAWPLEEGWRERVDFYQLYHLLNHANLFGGGYVGRSRQVIESLAGR